MEFTTNTANLDSEHSVRHEVQNPTNNSKRVLLPLEPDFSNMSDPSVVIELPDNLEIGQQTDFPVVIFPEGISLERKHKSMKRRRRRRSGDVDRLLHPPLLGVHLQTLAKEEENQF